MKPLALAAAVLSCLASVGASADSPVKLPSTFKPPQVFKNTNLVHIVSLEKNYAKEAVNVQIENVASEPQDEYFVPFTTQQLSRVGGFEAKDRKNAETGPFTVQRVEFDADSDVQYYRIKLPAPLQPGAQQTLGMTFFVLKAYSPLPMSIEQDEKQYLVYDFNAYAPSAYATVKQKTEVKFSSTIQEYTILDGQDNPVKSGNKLSYGPFPEAGAGAVQPLSVRFEFTKPVLHVSELERDVEVSHWGGNVAFEERYTMFHRGANLTSQFSRVKWQQSNYYNPTTYALKEMKFPLKPGSVDTYFYDVQGNVSTSRFRSNKREALLEAKPRYPVFGGWRYPFTIGWNSDAKNFLRSVAGDGYVLNVPFIEGPKQPEGIEYSSVTLKVILPEGATNLKYHTEIPGSSITSTSVDLHKTFLDTIGRTVLTVNAANLVDDLRDRALVVTYDLPLSATLRKPLIVFSSMIGMFVLAWVIGGVEVKISGK